MALIRRPSRADAEEAVRTIISFIGDDPKRPGLKDTPKRVIKAWEKDWGLGYNSRYIREQNRSILGGQFVDGAEQADEMVVLTDIRFDSFCEHHLALFSGSVDVGYIPRGVILGLSKLTRVVALYSKRLQVQERLTNQIANFINDHCKPIGVGVIVRASHSCMSSRGVHQPTVTAQTSALRGEMLEKPEVRDEFLRLVGR